MLQKLSDYVATEMKITQPQAKFLIRAHDPLDLLQRINSLDKTCTMGKKRKLFQTVLKVKKILRKHVQCAGR